MHNHLCYEAESYNGDSLIDDDDLFKVVAAQIDADGKSRLIRDGIEVQMGPFAASRFSNLKDYRLGGGTASGKLERIMQMLQDTEGGRSLLVHDQEKL